MPESSNQSNKPDEAEQAAERQSPSSRIVHEAILAEGLEELERPSLALAWSALAGGLSMGFSLIAEAMLRSALPDAPWRPLVAKLGYSVGFLIVILGRQQLFTENTLTPILPLLERKVHVSIANVLRLWGIVLGANLVGCAAFAIVVTRTSAVDRSLHEAIVAIGREAMASSFGTILLRGVFAGWLIALIVWLLPFAESARVWVIVIITWVIGVARFSHVIAGSIEAFAYASSGHTTWRHAITGFFVPALLGNLVGGVALVASLNHAQVVAGSEEASQAREESRPPAGGAPAR
ncbi:MAG TPA: formate/nitrite transporter family protein [Opitutaceae bacterium]|nr:formate/nitrite transporter family protein [Opitutaceae bacterium]